MGEIAEVNFDAWSLRGYPDPYLPPELTELVSGEGTTREQAALTRGAEHFAAGLPGGPGQNLTLPKKADEAVLAAARLRASLAAVSAGFDVPEVDLDVARYGMVGCLSALGMWAAKRQLEDAILEVELPDRWRRLCDAAKAFQERHQAFVEEISAEIEKSLARAGVDATTSVVWCSVAGASRRLQTVRLPNFDLARATDFFDVYVLVDDPDDCYRALAAIHLVGPPAPGGFQDLIVAPHANGFSGLTSRIRVRRHADVVKPVPESVNVIMQTAPMNDVAWHGIAHPLCRVDDSPPRFVATLKAKLGGRVGVRPSITVYSKGGRRLQPTAREMDTGATVLDLAYVIHSQIGNEAVSAIVNGEPVDSLGQVLEENDLVEIRRDSEGRNVRTLEDLDLVTTQNTRRLLKHGLNQHGLVMKGCLAIHQQLEDRGFSIHERKELDDLVAVASGQLNGTLRNRPPSELYSRVGRLIEIAEAGQQPFDPGAAAIRKESISAGSVAAAVADEVIRVGMERLLPGDSAADQWRPTLVDGTGSAPRFAKLCSRCRPGPTDEIVGIRRKGHVTVHVGTCRHVPGTGAVPMRWMPVSGRVRSVISLSGSDRARLVIDVCERVSRLGCGLEQVTAKVGHLGRARITLHVYGDSSATISKLVKALERVPGVATVQPDTIQMPDIRDLRIRSIAERKGVDRSTTMKGLSRSDAVPLPLHLRASGPPVRHSLIRIPYDPQHPCVTGRFYGRHHERATLAESFEAGDRPFIFIHGPRTIGKSSLAIRFGEQLARDKQAQWVRADLRGCRGDTSAEAFEKVIVELRKKLPPNARVPDQSSPERTVDALIDAYDRPLLLILDEFGGPLESFAAKRLGTQFFDWVRRSMDSTERKVALMMAGPPEALDLLDSVAHRDLGERLARLPLKGLTPAAAREMFTEPLVEAGVSVRQDAAEAVAAQCGGHPYYLILLLQKLADRLNQYREQWQVSKSDVSASVDDLLADRLPLTSWVAEAAPEPITQVCLDALVRTEPKKKGDEFVDLADVAAKAGLGQAAVRAAMERLCRYQVVEDDHGVPRYRCAFPLLREWVRRGGVRKDFFSDLDEDARSCLFAAADRRALGGDPTQRRITEATGLRPDIAAAGIESLVDAGLLEKRRRNYRFNLPIVRVWIEEDFGRIAPAAERAHD